MIIHIKELINSKTSLEMISFYKEEFAKLYNQLSECLLEQLKTNDFIEFVNRSNVYCYINEKNNILGVITALYERKLIHNGGIVCHIEDVIVDKNHRNQKIASKLIKYVIDDAKLKKAYKIILDCTPEMTYYYHNFNFEEKNVQMALYF